jgi:23S rRNA (uracil1939-C5)-methyltransferase
MTRLTLTVTDIADSGAGISEIEEGGLPLRVFVPGALPGDRVVAEPLPRPQGSHSLVVQVKEFAERSPFRRERPFCEYYARCGGCPLAGLAYGAQLELKRRRLLALFGGILPAEAVAPVLGLKDGEAPRRNKALLHFSGAAGALKLGLYAQGTHEVLPETLSCPQCPAWMERASRAVLELGADLGLDAWDEQKGEGMLRALLLRDAGAGGRLAALVCGREPDKAFCDALARSLGAAGVTAACVFVNEKPGNAPLRGRSFAILGDGTAEAEIGGLAFRVRPETFLQVNPVQTPRLYETALGMAGLSSEADVLDLYCGVGTLTLLAARRSRRVLGVEIVPASIAQAKENARLNGIRNADFLCGPAEALMPEVAASGFAPRAVIADPPRKGLEESVPAAIAALKPERIVYIACGPAALARDCRRFAALGYRAAKLVPVDLFPETQHVEAVCLLEKAG